MSNVYFVKNQEDLSKFFDLIKLEGKVGVKTHFGEPGNKTFPNPKIVELFCNKVNGTLIETNVLYKSPRTETESHKKVALDHGFDFADIDILEGDFEVPINLKHFKSAFLGKGLENYDSLLFVSHFKGHGLTGFGGSLKNIGMGLASRKGKLQLHSGSKPSANDSCTACGICKNECPVNAISINGKALVSKDCIGCAKCIAVCPIGAMNVTDWGASKEVQEKIVEYCKGVLKNKKSFFINLVVDVTENCDCLGKEMKPVINDIGFLASSDPVALDKACYDLCIEKAKKNIFDEFCKGNPLIQLEYAEKLGIGSLKYNLINL